MRIGLNLLYLIPGVVGGTEVYASGLLAGLARIDAENEYIVFVNRESAIWPLPVTPNFTRIICPVWATGRTKRYFFEQVHLPKLLKDYRLDIVHSLGYVSPLFPPCPFVVTVFDLNFRAFGSQMPWMKRWALEFFVRQSVRRARHVVTASEFARGQILSAMGISPNKITVIPGASSSTTVAKMDSATVLRNFGIGQPYIIAFSGSSPNKNIPRLIQAFMQIRCKLQLPHQLVLVGHKPYAKIPDGLNVIVFTGYVDESSKQALLAGAEMLVLPSTYEGFGLPVLEAQQVGVPVVCSKAASLPEVAGDAALFFDPYCVDDLGSKLLQVAKDVALQNELRRRGFENVNRFSWEITAEKMLHVYHGMVK